MKKLTLSSFSLALLFVSALSPLGPASPSMAAPYIESDIRLLEEAALALGYRARLVIEQSQDLATNDSDANLDKATRLGRQIQVLALDMAAALKAESPEAEVLDQLAATESLVLQLDATKRQLQSSHGQERELIDALNAVRRTYFYLKQLLVGRASR